MGIKMTTQISDISTEIYRSVEIIREEVLRALSYLGEVCVRKIKDRTAQESWIDQTGNLRSSIGYAIYEYGRKEIESAFRIVKKGQEGVIQGQEVIDELARTYSNTYALVVVAGMNYAEYVEAKDNKDVLASTELFAKKEVGKYLNEAKNRAKRKIDKL